MRAVADITKWKITLGFTVFTSTRAFGYQDISTCFKNLPPHCLHIPYLIIPPLAIDTRLQNLASNTAEALFAFDTPDNIALLHFFIFEIILKGLYFSRQSSEKLIIIGDVNAFLKFPVHAQIWASHPESQHLRSFQTSWILQALKIASPSLHMRIPKWTKRTEAQYFAYNQQHQIFWWKATGIRNPSTFWILSSQIRVGHKDINPWYFFKHPQLSETVPFKAHQKE